VLQTITNHFSAARLLDLGSGSARGPFLVTQSGVAPSDDKARERMFVLRPDGKWVDFNCYACQGRPDVMDELVFNTTAEVMKTMARLTGKPEVVDLPIDEAGLKAWSSRQRSSDLVQAAHAWAQQYKERHRQQQKK
jgi:hypothetical protein